MVYEADESEISSHMQSKVWLYTYYNENNNNNSTFN